jgi:hypothetical protein
VGEVRQRRLFQAFSVTVLGLALACAPMALASAKSKPKHHSKKHHSTTTTTKPKTVSKGGLSPGSKLCVTLAQADSSSGSIGTDVEKAVEQAMASGNLASAYASVKAAMLSSLNTSVKEEGEAESALSGAPANVQAAMKGLFTFVGSYETAIQNSTSITQLETSIATIPGTAQVEADGLTVSNYVMAQCGTTTTTTASLP